MVPPPAPPPPPTTADPSVPEPTAVLPEDDEDEDDEDNSDLEDDFLESDRPSSPVSVSAEDELAAEIEKDEMISRNTLALEAQVEERPLAKMQEELQEREDSKSETGEDQQQPSSEDVTAENGLAPAPAEHEKHVRKALLKNDDTELVRVQRVRRRTSLWHVSRANIRYRSSSWFTSGFTLHTKRISLPTKGHQRERSDRTSM